MGRSGHLEAPQCVLCTSGDSLGGCWNRWDCAVEDRTDWLRHGGRNLHCWLRLVAMATRSSRGSHPAKMSRREGLRCLMGVISGVAGLLLLVTTSHRVIAHIGCGFLLVSSVLIISTGFSSAQTPVISSTDYSLTPAPVRRIGGHTPTRRASVCLLSRAAKPLISEVPPEIRIRSPHSNASSRFDQGWAWTSWTSWTSRGFA